MLDDEFHHLKMALVDMEASSVVEIATELDIESASTKLIQHHLLEHAEGEHIVAEAINGIVRPHVDCEVELTLAQEELDVLRAWVVLIITVLVMRLVDRDRCSTSIVVSHEFIDHPLPLGLQVRAVVGLDLRLVVLDLAPDCGKLTDVLNASVRRKIPEPLCGSILRAKLSGRRNNHHISGVFDDKSDAELLDHLRASSYYFVSKRGELSELTNKREFKVLVSHGHILLGIGEKYSHFSMFMTLSFCQRVDIPKSPFSTSAAAKVNRFKELPAAAPQQNILCTFPEFAMHSRRR